MKSPHHFLSSLIWRLTFAATAVAQSHCGFPPRSTICPVSRRPSHQWLTVSNYHVNSGPSPCLHSFHPIEHRRAIITGFTAASLCEPSLQVIFYIMQNREASVTLEDAGEPRSGSSRRWHLSTFVPHFAALFFHWKSSGEMSKVIIITVTITVIITLASLQFEPFGFTVIS